MALYAPSPDVSADLTSFSSEDRFSYSAESGFRVAIPRVGYWDYHTRAKISELKARLVPDVKLTRGGNISKHQAGRLVEEDYRYLIDSSEAFILY